jgi:hypothetical protein
MARARTALIALLSALVSAFLSTTSATAAEKSVQNPCDVQEPGHGVPIRVPLGPADLGVQPEACPHTSASLEGRGALVVAREDFYGSLLAGASLRGTVALPNDTWLSFWAPGVEYRFAANASVEADSTDLGAGALGYHVPLRLSRRATIAPFMRVLIPTETIFVRAHRWGLDHGATLAIAIDRQLELVGGLSFVDLVTVNGTRGLHAWMPSMSADAVYRPWRALAFAGGCGLRPLDSVDPRASIRVYPWRGAMVAVAAVAPMLGRDRTDIALALSMGWEAF